MKYRRAGNIDVSEIAFDVRVSAGMSPSKFRSLVERALASGIDFFHAPRPAETSALGEALGALGSRRKAVVTAGIPTFFAAYAAHHMPAAEFLDHELSDRLERLSANYVDCFVLDLGEGRSVELESVLKEEIHAGVEKRGLQTSSYEGGIFLHETLAEALDALTQFKQQGRIRLIGVCGENISAVKRVLVKHEAVDVAFVPYSFAFRAAADELIPIAAETKTAVVVTKPLWWRIRGIPVTVLAESPYPADAAKVALDAASLKTAACKWALSYPDVASVVASTSSPEEIAGIAGASSDSHWTRAEEQALQAVASVATAQRGIFLVLSAMNSDDPDLRALGWAACLRMGWSDFGYDPNGGESARADALKALSLCAVKSPAQIAPESLDELL